MAASGETADGALLNWATPERIAISRVRIDEGAARAGLAPGLQPVVETMEALTPVLIRSWL
jgi:hypothetical protein